MREAECAKRRRRRKKRLTQGHETMTRVLSVGMARLRGRDMKEIDNCMFRTDHWLCVSRSLACV